MFSKALAAAAVKPLILSVLSRRDSYGYEIIQAAARFSGGVLDWQEGMLYPLLRKMEREGLIMSYWGVSQVGRKRRYYTLLPEGKEALETEKKEWMELNAAFIRLWGGELEYV